MLSYRHVGLGAAALLVAAVVFSSVVLWARSKTRDKARETVNEPAREPMRVREPLLHGCLSFSEPARMSARGLLLTSSHAACLLMVNFFLIMPLCCCLGCKIGFSMSNAGRPTRDDIIRSFQQPIA